MNALSVYRGLAASLAAMLRATAPSGDTLTGAESLEHNRTVAHYALRDAAAFVLRDSADGPALDQIVGVTDALETLLAASERGARPTAALVSARVFTWDALTVAQAELVADTASGMAGLTGAERAHHGCFLSHEQQVAERYWLLVQTDPTLRAADFARDNPFVAPAA